MRNIELQSNTYWLLAAVATKVHHELGAAADSYGLSGAQLHAICLLSAKATVPMSTVICGLGCDASYVTIIIDKLAEAGYITRQDSPSDRRSKVVGLTRKGAKIRAKIINDITKLNDALQLTDAQHGQLRQLLTKVSAKN